MTPHEYDALHAAIADRQADLKALMDGLARTIPEASVAKGELQTAGMHLIAANACMRRAETALNIMVAELLEEAVTA